MAELSIPVSVLRAHDTKDFIVYSPALDLSSCGRTEKQALKMFAEAARLFLAELDRMGTADEVLSELGWRKVSKPTPHWIPPELLRQKRVQLNLSTRA